MTKHVVWYVDVLGDVKTNGIVAERLDDTDACPLKLCADGKERNLWRCNDYSLIAELLQNRESQGLRFHIYRQMGRYGLPRLWPFDKPRTPRLQARDSLRHIRALELEASELYA